MNNLLFSIHQFHDKTQLGTEPLECRPKSENNPPHVRGQADNVASPLILSAGQPGNIPPPSHTFRRAEIYDKNQRKII